MRRKDDGAGEERKGEEMEGSVTGQGWSCGVNESVAVKWMKGIRRRRRGEGHGGDSNQRELIGNG